MKKKIILVSAMLAFGFMASLGGHPVISKAVAADDMAQVQLILKKLRSSMSSMKDFDALEEAGMEKADVDRLRRAMKSKINQMISNAVELITAL